MGDSGVQVDGATEVDGQIVAARRELETWKSKVEKADDEKAKLLVAKLDGEEAKAEAKLELSSLSEQRDHGQKTSAQDLSTVQDEIRKLVTRKQELSDQLRRRREELEAQRAESSELKNKFTICARVSGALMFSRPVDEDDAHDQGRPIRGVFVISQRTIVPLQGGQALISFERAAVASKILKMSQCTVSCGDTSVDVWPKRVSMDPTVKFEVHLDVSRKELLVSNIPASMAEERTRDRLGMSFSRPSRGGAEVEGVEYEEGSGTGRVAFLHPGAAEALALRKTYLVDLEPAVEVQVGPVQRYQLCQFQTFCGTAERTVLLDGIRDFLEEEEDAQDQLEIHFQKTKNDGGEIHALKYVSQGRRLLAVFSEDVAECS